MVTTLQYQLKRLNRSVRARLALASPRWSPLPPSPAPLLSLEYPGDRHSKTLIVFLTGIDDLAEDFERRGFIDELRRRDVPADALALDAHYGYYAARVIHERLTEDVIVPARAAGYEQIWLAGVSLGGFGAASYAARYPSEITGLSLFAPYLGGPALIGEIARAGGMRHWEPGHVAGADYQRALWAGLKQHFAINPDALRIHLGYGRRDMFAKANSLLADALPENRVYSIPGGHDWSTWRTLWRMFLADWDIGA